MTLSSGPTAYATSQYSHLSSVESEIVSKINGTNIYDYDLELEQIALNHTASLYSFCSSGSTGANETATWIEEQFESFGLDTHNETFQFTTWNLLAQPVLKIDTDGNQSTSGDQETISSFECEHYSWPTPEGGVFSEIVTLPLPYQPIPWSAVDTTGKVLLIGGEVELDSYSFLPFRTKLQTETPSAVIFSWSSNSMASAPVVLDSCGGRPNSGVGPFFWNLHIPVGWVSHTDGLLILDSLNSTAGASAFVSIPSVIGQGPHYNIVAKVQGTVDPQKMIIISAHYDSTMDAAFCDNGAGTSALIELSRVFSEAARQGIYKPQYTLVFLAFAGEELGLEGSANYVKQHASELNNVVAMIDLDSLGSQTMEISKTFPDDRGLDLESVVMKAGSDLNIKIDLADPGTKRSDFQAFLDPPDTNDLQLELWIANNGIGNITRVKSSILIDSSPLTWVHTENDSSTLANWVSPDNLENQTRVTGLSVVRILSTLLNPFMLELYASATAAGILAVIVIYLERSRLRTRYKRFAREIGSTIGMRESLYVIILTAIFLFASFAFYASVGETEVISQGYPRIVTVQYYGAPFKMLGVVSREFARSEVSPQTVQAQVGTIDLLWAGLIANIALFSLAAFVITYAVTTLRNRVGFSREYNRQIRESRLSDL